MKINPKIKWFLLRLSMYIEAFLDYLCTFNKNVHKLKELTKINIYNYMKNYYT